MQTKDELPWKWWLQAGRSELYHHLCGIDCGENRKEEEDNLS